MGQNNVDWQTLEFACVKDQPPPVDPEADVWFKQARALQKKDEERYADEIFRLYKMAAERNHYKALQNLTWMYSDGIGVEQDEREAVRLTERLIDMGASIGYYHMGVLLQDGIGVKQDKKASAIYIRKAADMGNPHAQLVLGKKLMSLRDDALRPKVLPIAEAALHCALSQEMAEAGYELGGYYLAANREGDVSRGLEAMQAAAKLGHNMSLFSLKNIFKEGRHGLAIDEKRADCYAKLKAELKEDNSKRFPNLDRICPLPPEPMPKS